jgi:hypothetical protein
VRRSRIAVLAAAAVTACVLAVPTVARAQPKPGQAMVRVAHFSPDASYVDVYMVSLNRKQLFPNVFYKSVSAYWAVAAGPFTYEVRAAGAAPESEPVIQVKGNLAGPTGAGCGSWSSDRAAIPRARSRPRRCSGRCRWRRCG